MRNLIGKIGGLIWLYCISFYRYLKINLQAMYFGSEKVTLSDCLSYGKIESHVNGLSPKEENDLIALIIRLSVKIDRSAMAWLDRLCNERYVDEVRVLAFDLLEHLKACEGLRDGSGRYLTLLEACQSTARTRHAFNVIYASSSEHQEAAMFSLTSMGYHMDQLKLIHELGIDGLKQRIKEGIDEDVGRLESYGVAEDSSDDS